MNNPMNECKYCGALAGFHKASCSRPTIDQPLKATKMTREWGVRWEAIGTVYPSEVHAKSSKLAAEECLERSAFPGVVVSREVTEWTES